MLWWHMTCLCLTWGHCFSVMGPRHESCAHSLEESCTMHHGQEERNVTKEDREPGPVHRRVHVHWLTLWPCSFACLGLMFTIVNSWPPWRGCAVTGIWMFSSNGSNVNEICFSQSNRQYSRITRNRERKESNELFFVGLQCMWIEERGSCFGGGLCFVCFFC